MIQDERKLSRLSRAELLQKDPLYQNTVLCQNIYHPDLSNAMLYTHDIIEISMVVSGSGAHRILNQVIPCKVGDIYMITPDIPHGYFVNEAGEELIIRQLLFDPKDWFDGAVATQENPRFCYGVFCDNAATAYAMLNAQTQQEVDALYHEIEQELSNKKQEWKDTVRAHLALLLITVGRYVNDAIKNIPSVPPKEWGVVSSTIHQMMEQFDDSNLTLEAIAESLYISKSHLSRQFKRLTGESFSEYLRKIRLGHACRLLRETNLTVEEIIAQCGLRDVPSFYQTFHAHMDMTPNQYRTTQNQISMEQQKGEKIMSILNEISENLQRGKAKIVKELVQQAIDEGCPPADILNEGLLHGMNIIGEKFKNNEVYVPEVLVAARAMNMGAQILKPHLVASGVVASGRVCIGTVQGDLHDIGKNLVRMMMEGKGLEVVDLGVDVPPETFVQTAIEQNCQVICCSALLTTTMGVMADVVKVAEAAGIRDKVKIMIGGAPTTEDFCRQIGADCYTSDAASAADAAVELCKG